MAFLLLRDLMTESTANKILDAAKMLFIQNGYAGTSISKIAAAANVNHSLIFHHFGNKIKLWHAVKKSIVEVYYKKAPILPSIDLDFPNFIRTLIDNSVQYYQNNPDVVQLLNWQRIEAEDQPEIGLSCTNEVSAWVKAFSHYQKAGVINAKLKPQFIVTLVLGITSTVALDPNVFISDPKHRQAYLDFCVLILCKSLGV
jgi:AcrR family transcriptional regulator